MNDQRHICSLSGGKDSTALAVYMHPKIPEMEYVFADTGKELPETYEMLDKLARYLRKEIVYLRPKLSFDELIAKKGGYLPSMRVRYCTPKLKSKPFEEYIGKDDCIMYVGIRADEGQRAGCRTRKPNIKPVYPFVDDNIDEAGVRKILEDSGIGIPAYYAWRSRSGCYFCFFQRSIEWVGLLENHPDLFDKAQAYEKNNFSWRQHKPLSWIRENKEAIKERYRKRQAKKRLPSDERCIECHL